MAQYSRSGAVFRIDSTSRHTAVYYESYMKMWIFIQAISPNPTPHAQGAPLAGAIRANRSLRAPAPTDHDIEVIEL